VETLAEKLRGLRKAKGWTQGQLELHSGVKRSYISLIETGERKRPGADILFHLAAAFQVPPDEFYQSAGYRIKEDNGEYTAQETPEQIITKIKLDIRRLEKLLEKKEE